MPGRHSCLQRLEERPEVAGGAHGVTWKRVLSLTSLGTHLGLDEQTQSPFLTKNRSLLFR